MKTQRFLSPLRLWLLAFGVLLHFTSTAQVVTSNPLFPTDQDSVVILFNAREGNGALAGVTPPIYAHTGVITQASTSPSDWRNVQGTWGVAFPKTLMTPLGNDLYEIRMRIRNFYGVPAADTIEQLAFVFRNTNGSIVGRAANGGDIYLPIYLPNQLNARIFRPDADIRILKAGDSISFFGAASQSCSLSVRVNGNLAAQTINDSLLTTLNFPTNGVYSVVFTANNGSAQVLDSFRVVVTNPAAFVAKPAGTPDGISYPNDSTVRLSIYAPFKEQFFVIGDFNDWLPHPNYLMNRTPDSLGFWIQINGLTPGREYAFQYLVDGNLRIAEPLAEKVLDPWNDGFITSTTYPNLMPYPSGKTSGIVSVLQTAKPAYQWATNNFQRPDYRKLVTYELLVRDFVSDRRYKTIVDSMGYFRRLGINCIEIMPIMEFEGNDSWGYNPSFYLAPDKAYGTDYNLKEFIDSCHANGIAVVLDMVLNHAFGQSPLVQLWWDGANNRPAANSPYFNPIAKHDFNVGYDFNHDSPATRLLFKRVVRHWLQEYRFDGFRFDLSKGFTQKNTLGNTNAWGQYDSSRVALWKMYHDTLQAISPGSYTILEHFADNTEERELANYGLMFWGNINHDFSNASMGLPNSSNFSWASHKNRTWNSPRLMAYAESHDEERMMYRNLTSGNQNAAYSTRRIETALERMEQTAVFLLSIPGPKMIWQFGELGYDFSINRCPNGTINSGCRTDAKPVRWDYFVNPERKMLFNIYAAMIKLKTSEPAFSTDTFFVNALGAVKWIRLNHSDMNVTVLGNFDIVPTNSVVTFSSLGKWYEYFTGDSIEVISNTFNMALQPGEYRLYTSRRLAAPDLSVSVPPVDQAERGNLKVFPNPADELLFIDTQADKIRIYDQQGRMVRQLDSDRSSVSQSWDLKNQQGARVASGLYLLRTSSGQFAKIIVK